MRREGRQHGMVRTFYITPPSFLAAPPLNRKPPTRIVNKFDTPPTAGLFIKVPNKPTNHSKFTSKCDRSRVQCTDCHFKPVCKSKVKSKSTNKVKSSVASVNHQLNTWKIMGDNSSSYSASSILDDLDTDYRSIFSNNDNEDDNDNNDYEYEYDDDEEEEGEFNDDVVIHVGVTDDGDDGYVGFYDVGYVMNAVDEGEEEGWSIVGENQISSI